MSRSLLALLILALSACGAIPPKLDPLNEAQIADNVAIKQDEFTKTTWYEAPTIGFYDPTFLRAGGKAGVIVYQVYVIEHTSEWLFLDAAYDDHGTKLQTRVIDRDVGSCRGGCSLSEHIVISVERDYLERAADRGGMRFKVIGKDGHTIRELPAPYIRAFLSKVPDASAPPPLEHLSPAAP